MITICIAGLKGGISKTTTSINVAHILAHVYKQRVLLVDNDKQGNSSKFFKAHSYDNYSITDVLLEKGFDVKRAIKRTDYEGLDILPANMTLLNANKRILLDTTRQQQTRLKKALAQVEDDYDYVVIDNAPDLSMSDINALVACDHVLFPIKVDDFAFDGVKQIHEQILEIKEEFKPSIEVVGGFVVMYQQSNVNSSGLEYLQKRTLNTFPIFDTVIRRTVKVDESTFAKQPLLVYDKKATATKDYQTLVSEYLQRTGQPAEGATIYA